MGLVRATGQSWGDQTSLLCQAGHRYLTPEQSPWAGLPHQTFHMCLCQLHLWGPGLLTFGEDAEMCLIVLLHGDTVSRILVHLTKCLARGQ